MNVKEILESKDSIAELISKSMPINTSFKLSKMQMDLNVVLESFEKKRKDLFEKYGEKQKDNDDEMYIPKDNIEVYSKAMESVIDEDIDIKIEQISIVECGDIEIAPAHLTNLSWLFKE